MSKVRVLDSIPVMCEDGSLKYAQLLAGSSNDMSEVDTDILANGTAYVQTDTAMTALFDEDDGWGEAQ